MIQYSGQSRFSLVLVRCVLLVAIVGFMGLTGCVRDKPKKNPYAEPQKTVSHKPDDVPVYLVDSSPDVDTEPPSPFFTHHTGEAEQGPSNGGSSNSDFSSSSNSADGHGRSTVAIADTDAQLFDQPSPFASSIDNSKSASYSSSKSTKMKAKELDLAVNNAVDMVSPPMKEEQTVAKKPVIRGSSDREIGSSSGREKSYPVSVNEVPLDEAFPLQEHVPAIVEDRANLYVKGSKRQTSYIVSRGDTLWGIANRFSLNTKQLIAANKGVNDANVISVGMKLLIPPKNYDPSKTFYVASSSAAVTPKSGSTSSSSAKTSSNGSVYTSPSSPKKPSVNAKKVEVHVLQKGETLWSVARQYRISVTDLMLLNRLGEASSLRAGREILVPVQSGSQNIVTSSKTNFSQKSSSNSAGSSTNSSTQYKVQKGDTLWRISREFSVTVDELLRWNNGKNLNTLAAGMSINVSPSQKSSSRLVKSAKTIPSRSSAAKNPPPRTSSPKQSSSKTSYSGQSLSKTIKPKSGFRWPHRGKIIRSFGWYEGKPHTGIDIKGAVGEKIKAAATGTVIFAGPMRGYGKVVILDHKNGFFTVYGSLLEVLVNKGTASRPVVVRSGTYIGRIGAVVEGPESNLHFEIRLKNKAIDPMKYLSF